MRAEKDNRAGQLGFTSEWTYKEYPNIHFMVADGYQRLFAPETFKAIFLMNNAAFAYEKTRDEDFFQKAMENIYSMLKNEGYLFISANHDAAIIRKTFAGPVTQGRYSLDNNCGGDNMGAIHKYLPDNIDRVSNLIGLLPQSKKPRRLEQRALFPSASRQA
jgi:hypothetical protein